MSGWAAGTETPTHLAQRLGHEGPTGQGGCGRLTVLSRADGAHPPALENCRDPGTETNRLWPGPPHFIQRKETRANYRPAQGLWAHRPGFESLLGCFPTPPGRSPPQLCSDRYSQSKLRRFQEAEVWEQLRTWPPRPASTGSQLSWQVSRCPPSPWVFTDQPAPAPPPAPGPR